MRYKWRIISWLLAIPLLLSAKHTGPAYDARPRDSLDILVKDLAKRYQLTLIGSGLGAFANDENAHWGVSLTSGQFMTYEEARELARELSYPLLYKIYHDPLFAACCKERSKELADKSIAFKVAFWDENTLRPLHPYVAQIRLAEGKMHYFYADPVTQALQEPIVETLDSLQLPPYK